MTEAELVELEHLREVAHDCEVVEDDDTFKEVAGVMLGARRLYIHAVQNMTRLFEERGWSDASFDAACRLMRAKGEAEAPDYDASSLHALSKDLERFVAPLLRDWASHIAVEKNQARLKALIRYDPEREAVERKRPVVVVGAREALDRYWADVVRPTLVAHGHDHAWLVRGRVDKDALGVGQYQVDGMLWIRNCSSRSGTAILLKRELSELLSRPPDVIVCDDLTLAVPQLYEGRDPIALASDAVRHLGRASNDLAALLIGFLPGELTESSATVLLKAQAHVIVLG